TVEETLAQTLMEIKAAKPKAKGIVFQDQEEYKEKGNLFMELMEKRRQHFAALRAQEKRNRPPTKAQKRTQISEAQKSNEKKEERSEEKAKGNTKKMLGKKRAGKEQQ
ncbi:hypothetical protein Tco_1189557, partial [Tanacetum coccineum]